MTATESEKMHPSLLMRLIALKKAVFAMMILSIAVLSGFSWRHYDAITAFADTYILNAEYGLVRWLLMVISHTQPETLRRISQVTAIYGSLLGLAAWGLWVGRSWAEPLFIALVSLLLPLEILEVWHHTSPSKIILLMVNGTVVLFLVLNWIRHRQKAIALIDG